MSYEIPGKCLPYEAGEDLSTYQYCFVKLNASKLLVHCDTVGEQSIGVLQNDPTLGMAGSVMVDGVSKVKAGGAIAVNDPIGVAVTTGRGVKATTTAVAGGGTTLTAGNVQGYAEEAVTNTGEIFAMRISQTVAPTSAI